MRAPTLLRIAQILATTASLALVMGAYASEEHGAEHGAKAERPEKPEKAEKATKGEKPEKGDKAERAEKPEKAAKGEGAGEGKRELPSAVPSAGSVSMAELRDMIDQKIAEVRSKREPAPVVRIKPRSPAPKPAARNASEHLALAAVGGDVHGDPRALGGAPQPGGDGHGPAPNLMGHDVHWAYAGDTGPDSWGRLKPEFQQCMLGKRQSPIDIRDGIPVQLDPIQFDYRSSAFRVIDNGHTVQVNVEPGNSITVGGRRFDLIQFHFHRPSEERINGRQYDMVAHLVHKDLDGRLAVVAVLMDQGKSHPLVQQVWNNLPLEKNQEQMAQASMDLNQLLPEHRQYYTYMGSLTTPPCSEGVLWMVMKQPAAMSRDQVAVFSKLYPMNARPIQSTSGRLIKEGQ
jgi:carbonic anhydrase